MICQGHTITKEQRRDLNPGVHARDRSAISFTSSEDML